MKPGDVVFCKRATAEVGPQSKFRQFQGHGICLLIGHVPNGAPVPPKEWVLRALGQFGFITFDEIINLTSKETGMEIAQLFAQKWYGSEGIVTPAPAVIEPTLALVTQSDPDAQDA